MSNNNSDHETNSELSRRGFLRVSALGGCTLAMSSGGLLMAANPSGLLPADANGIRVQPSFSARVVATTGQLVEGTSHTWHGWPDGGDCFALPDGGWSYVSNSELFNNAGGVSYLRFNSDGDIVDAGSCLTGTTRNCSGGKSPWGTWLSCEEIGGGAVWECDPLGASAGVERPGMGRFRHEAAACHVGQQAVFLTEDFPSGALYRFLPDTWGDLSTGTLEVLTEPAPGTLLWQAVPDPDGDPTPCREQVPNTKIFNGGEGIDLVGDNVVFTTKGDNRVWKYDPYANVLDIMYDPLINVNGVLAGVDNVEVSSEGVVYVCEDGDDMQIVLVRNSGWTFPVVQIEGNPTSEICGAAFDPSGTRMYFSDQRNPGRTIEVTGPWNDFTQTEFPGC